VTVADEIAALREEMASRPAGLLRHVRRVAVEAADLARRWDADQERAELAVWGHDLFRAHTPAEQLSLAREAGLPITEADVAEPVLLHGPLAAIVVRERFGVRDDDALAAIRDHTLGSARMPLLAKVILIADKVESRKRRRTPVMPEIRRLARRDLDAALLCWADWKWVDERAHGWLGHPHHWEARMAWVREHHADAMLPERTPLEQFDR
jgi:predicted HD superfamily hydrolase involved in NAD metabolism